MKAALVLVLCLGHLTLGANPNYSYHVKIDDAAHANYQEKAESRKGPDAQGFYSVVEPNGALRTVQYTADDRGFNPIVSYSYGHPGSSAAVYQSLGGARSYAPAFVSDKRVQIVDKLVGAPPQLNIQPFALPSPGGYPGPVVVPAPLRVAPAPQLIAQAQGVNYAPAYMPPVTAFALPQRTYLPPTPQRVVYQPAPQQQVVYQPAPQQQVVYQSAPQQQVVYDAPKNFVAFSQPQVVYEAPRPAVAVAVPQQQVVYEATRPAVVTVQQPQVVYEAPRPAVIAVQKQVIQPAPVKVVSQVVDSYAVAPQNTVTNLNGPVYPDAIKVVQKPEAVYGVPNLAPGKPLGLETYAPAAPVIKVVQQAVKVAQPIQYVQQPIRVVQQQPIQYVQPAPAPVKYIQQQPKYIAPAPQVVLQQKVAAPVLGLYAGAIGYHTHNTGPDNYAHSYGTQGFQVTSSRKYNHGFISAPVVQKQVVQQQYIPQPVAQVIQPQPQLVQQTYAPQYFQPQPIRQIVAAPQPAPIAIQQTYAPQYYQPQAQAIRQVVAAPAPAPIAVQQPLPVYGSPVAKLVQPAAVAVPVGKKQNPLTFAYSYEQGGAKVSHSYSGSGW